MKLVVLLSLFTLSATHVMAQQLTPQAKERLEMKVDTLYTDEEKANMYWLAYEEVQKMNLDEATRNAYANTVFTCTYKISRLDDKDQDYTSEERKVIFDKLLEKMHAEVKTILPEKQFDMHKAFFDKIEMSFYRRSGWQWVRD